MEELARRAVACKGWRWVPGMLTINGDRMSDDGWPKYDTVDVGSSRVAETIEWSANPNVNALPDLTDPATLGCLLALVREAYRLRLWLASSRDGDMWYVDAASGALAHGKTEGEALVVALEAAP